MATLKDRLNKDLVVALKAKDEIRTATLRFLNSAIHNKEIDKRSKNDGKDEPLTDDEVLGVLKNEAKKRKEAVALFDKGDRADLSEKEKAELKIIEEYLPPELADEELKEIVGQVFSELNPSGPAEFGKVMGAVMKKIEGRASGDRVKTFIEEKLK
jgi:uncharacterized protein YqeY